MKFTIDQTVSEGGSKSFASAEEAKADPLAQKLFSVQGVKMLFMLNNFITVTKLPDSQWDTLIPGLTGAIEEHFS